MSHEALKVISSEFKLWGVKFDHRVTDGGHIELRWQTSPDKEIRSFVIAKTPSDWRGDLNNRAHVRRLFKADGLELKTEIKKPKPVLQKALAIPEPVETDACQIKMLRAEVADLTDMVLDLVTRISTHTLVPAPVMPQSTTVVTPLLDHTFEPPPMIRHVPAELPPIAVSQQEKNRSARTMAARRIKTIEYVNHHWATTDEIAKAMGLKKAVTYMKLYYLSKQGVIEQHRDQWRKKPNGKSNGQHREARP